MKLYRPKPILRLVAARALESLEPVASQRTLLLGSGIAGNEVNAVLVTCPHDAVGLVEVLPALIDPGLIGQWILVNSQELISSSAEQVQVEGCRRYETMSVT